MESKSTNKTEENIINIKKYFGQENLLITEKIFENSVKKYILRYCLGNYKNIEEVFNNVTIENIFHRDDLLDLEDLGEEELQEVFNIIAKTIILYPKGKRYFDK